MTLPAPVTNATSSTGGGKIVTLPVGTVGRTGSKPDLKTTGPSNRIVDVPVTARRTDRKEATVLKLNGNPSQVGRPQGSGGGNVLPGKVSAVSANSSPRFAQSMNQGQARKGFMH